MSDYVMENRADVIAKLNPSLRKKLLTGDEPKRILSLDGGGIRGALTLGMLKKIEDMARQKTGNSQLVLGDYYDLISGTSTGAIIACCLAIGKTVDEITNLYHELGKVIFGKGRRHKLIKRDATTIRAIFKENYSSKRLEKLLKETLADIRMDDPDRIKCGLAINTKRADTYSLWTVANHPNGKYYLANGHLTLWELCRASSAAPYYFKPKKLLIKTSKLEPFYATFIDGGVSLANNPGWISCLVVAEPSFGFAWPLSKDKLFITSLGTGNGQLKEDPGELEKLKTIYWAPKLSDLFMVDASEMNQVIFQLLGDNLGPSYHVDSQFGNVSNFHLLQPGNKLFSFMRHNVILENKWLTANLGISKTEEQIKSLTKMDYFENIPELYNLGKTYADKKINTII